MAPETGSTEEPYHPEFFIKEANAIIRVEGTLYNIPRQALMNSDLFKTMFSLNPGPGIETEGLTVDNPLDLSKADPSLKQADFDCFLKALCSPIYSGVEFDEDELQSILGLAQKWQFTELEDYAAELLADFGLSADRKLEIGAKYDQEDLLLDAYVEICMRPAPVDISIYDAILPHLGPQKFLDLLYARQQVWRFLKGLLKGSEKNYKCLHKPNHCHTNKKFRNALAEVFKLAEKQEVDRTIDCRSFERRFEDNMPDEDECMYCEAELESRIRRFIKKGEITRIVAKVMIPSSSSSEDDESSESDAYADLVFARVHSQ